MKMTSLSGGPKSKDMKQKQEGAPEDATWTFQYCLKKTMSYWNSTYVWLSVNEYGSYMF